MCQLPWRPRCSHTYILFLSHSSLSLFFLTYFSSSFHLIVHPHNFLIRFAGRTREHRAVRRLLFFFCMRTPSLLHYSGTSFLSPSFASSPSSSSSSSLLFHIHIQLHIHHTNDQQLRID